METVDQLLWVKQRDKNFNLEWIGVANGDNDSSDLNMVEWAKRFAFCIGADKFDRDESGKITEKFNRRRNRMEPVHSTPVSTTQLRKIFGEVRRIQMKFIDRDKKNSEAFSLEVQMLLPRLAYDVGRSKRSDKIRVLEEQLKVPLQKISTNTQFNKFVIRYPWNHGYVRVDSTNCGPWESFYFAQ